MPKPTRILFLGEIHFDPCVTYLSRQLIKHLTDTGVPVVYCNEFKNSANVLEEFENHVKNAYQTYSRLISDPRFSMLPSRDKARTYINHESIRTHFKQKENDGVFSLLRKGEYYHEMRLLIDLLKDKRVPLFGLEQNFDTDLANVVNLETQRTDFMINQLIQILNSNAIVDGGVVIVVTGMMHTHRLAAKLSLSALPRGCLIRSALIHSQYGQLDYSNIISFLEQMKKADDDLLSQRYH